VYDLSNKLDALNTKMDAKFDAVDARFDKLEARFDKLEARFDKLEARFDKLGRTAAKAHHDTGDRLYTYYDDRCDRSNFLITGSITQVFIWKRRLYFLH
jgi:hypothetical protein